MPAASTARAKARQSGGSSDPQRRAIGSIASRVGSTAPSSARLRAAAADRPAPAGVGQVSSAPP
jgi:hypothetical protein